MNRKDKMIKSIKDTLERSDSKGSIHTPQERFEEIKRIVDAGILSPKEAMALLNLPIHTPQDPTFDPPKDQQFIDTLREQYLEEAYIQGEDEPTLSERQENEPTNTISHKAKERACRAFWQLPKHTEKPTIHTPQEPTFKVGQTVLYNAEYGRLKYKPEKALILDIHTAGVEIEILSTGVRILVPLRTLKHTKNNTIDESAIEAFNLISKNIQGTIESIQYHIRMFYDDWVNLHPIKQATVKENKGIIHTLLIEFNVLQDYLNLQNRNTGNLPHCDQHTYNTRGLKVLIDRIKADIQNKLPLGIDTKQWQWKINVIDSGLIIDTIVL